MLTKDGVLDIFSDAELLSELIKRNGRDYGPRKIEWFQPTIVSEIEIDKDHTARIIMSKDDYKALKKIADNA